VCGTPVSIRARSVAENLREWFDSDETPTDFYQLLGKPRLHPSREELQDAIRSAYRTLHTLENHVEAGKLPRARALQRMIVEAEQVVGDQERWRDYDETLVAELRARYAAGAGGEASSWRRDNLGRWLARIQNVHPARIPGLVEAFLTAGCGPEDPPRVLAGGHLETAQAAVGQAGSRPPDRSVTEAGSNFGQTAVANGDRRAVVQPVHGPGRAGGMRREERRRAAVRGDVLPVAPSLRRGVGGQSGGQVLGSGVTVPSDVARPLPRILPATVGQAEGELPASSAEAAGTGADPGAAARALNNLLWMAGAAVVSAMVFGLIGMAIVLSRG
jgi:hypothetical protein